MIAKINSCFQKTPFQALLVVLAGTLVYSNTFHIPFIFDDYMNIVDNPKINSLTTFLRSISWFDFSYKSRWLAMATFAVNKSLGGLQVTGYHAINLLIHILSGLAVYLLTKTTLATFGTSKVNQYAFAPLIAALIFMLHPVQTQAVNYIVQRMTSLATFLCLVSLICYARAFQNDMSGKITNRRCQPFYYPAAMLACLFAMSTKEISFTLPLTIALYDVCFLKGTAKQRLVRLSPFMVCLVVMPFYLFGIHNGMDAVSHGGGNKKSPVLPHLTYLATECRVMVTYFRLLIFPVAQNFDYEYPVYTSFFQVPVVMSMALTGSVMACAVFMLKTSYDKSVRFQEVRRITGYAVLWFFITISIESAAVPLLDTIVEHRLYLPSAWLCIAAAVSLTGLYQHYADARKMVAATTFLILIMSGYATYQRNKVWHDSGSLWTDVIAQSPNKVRALTYLGKYYVDRMQPAAAIPLLERAIANNPSYPLAHYVLGLAFAQAGDSRRAILHYVMATRLAPSSPKGWEEAGQLYLEAGNYKEAEFYLRRAFELDPSTVPADERNWLFGVSKNGAPNAGAL